MNSYFDQQWDQQLAGRPQALAAFTSLSPAIRGIIPTKKPPRKAFSLSPAAFYLFTGAPPACSHR